MDMSFKTIRFKDWLKEGKRVSHLLFLEQSDQILLYASKTDQAKLINIKKREIEDLKIEFKEIDRIEYSRRSQTIQILGENFSGDFQFETLEKLSKVWKVRMKKIISWDGSSNYRFHIKYLRSEKQKLKNFILEKSDPFSGKYTSGYLKKSSIAKFTEEEFKNSLRADYRTPFNVILKIERDWIHILQPIDLHIDDFNKPLFNYDRKFNNIRVGNNIYCQPYFENPMTSRDHLLVIMVNFRKSRRTKFEMQSKDFVYNNLHIMNLKGFDKSNYILKYEDRTDFWGFGVDNLFSLKLIRKSIGPFKAQFNEFEYCRCHLRNIMIYKNKCIVMTSPRGAYFFNIKASFTKMKSILFGNGELVSTLVIPKFDLIALIKRVVSDSFQLKFIPIS